MSLASDYQVDLEVNGVPYGIWDRMAGGGVDSSERTYKPGGRKAPIALGGTASTSNIVVGKLYTSVEHSALKTLMALAGKAPCKVVKQFITADGARIGDPLTYSGKLKAVTPPDHDSESDDAAMIELEISVAGLPA